MELALLITGVAAAVVVGIAWALHKHGLAEEADRIGSFALLSALGLGLWELYADWRDWLHDVQFPKIVFGPDGSVSTAPPRPKPDVSGQLGHAFGQAGIELVRDGLITAVVFGVAYLVLRATKNDAPTAALPAGHT